MTIRPLGASDIEGLFDALSAELERRGVRAEIFLVGGAAIAVAFDPRRSTRDLDGVFVPTEDVRRAAQVVAEDHGLTDDWLNDAVKGFLPGPDPGRSRYFETPHLVVDVASAEYLLAMKLFASRAETDAEDIALLYRHLGYTTVDQGLDLVESAYPGRPLPARIRFLLEDIVTNLGA